MNKPIKKQHAMKCPKLSGRVCECDGYHTFGELYEHRITLFIALCRIIERNKPIMNKVWKSQLHSDGSGFEGWFILGIRHDNQITYHIPNSRWNECDFAITYERAPEFDGHTSDDVLERIKNL